MSGSSVCRPGGFELTERLLARLPYGRDEHRTLVDLGCGHGETLRRMRGELPGWELWGIDPDLPAEDAEINGEAEHQPLIHLRKGIAEVLPLEDHSVDILWMECSFSRVGNSEMALAEMHRVLKFSGRILLSDLYLREEGSGSLPLGDSEELQRTNCLVGRLETADQIRHRFEAAGFRVNYMQDVSRVLRSWICRQVGEDRDTTRLLGREIRELRERKVGYYLCEAEVSEVPFLLSYVQERSSFYREKYRSCDTEDWTHLPLTSAEDLRMNSEDLLCVSPKEIARIITLKSSGSAGRPKRIFFTEEDLERTAQFFNHGIRSLVEPGYRVAVFMEGPTHYSVGGLLKEGLSYLPAEVYVHGFVRDYEEAGQLAQGMDTLIGVPFQMYRLAKEHPELRPKTVLLSADSIPESMKRGIESLWSCKVFTHWGMSETGYGGGVQCHLREGYHLRDDDLLVEILDPVTGERVPEGRMGELVITTLHRRGMPLIRYRTGDLGRMIPGRCPCGYLLPRLDRIRGRLGGNVSLPDGRELSLSQLDEIMYRMPIRAYQSEWKGGLILHVLWEETADEHLLIEETERRVRILLGESLPLMVVSDYGDAYEKGKKMIRQIPPRH